MEDTVSANILKTKLESEDIPCFLHNENLTSLLPNARNLMGSGVRLMVPEELLERAIEIIDVEESEVSCPDCGSHELVNITKQKNIYRVSIHWRKIISENLLFQESNNR